MYKYDFTDMTAGILLILAGIVVSTIAFNSYPLGTPTRMGPGMFPAGLGVILALLGALLALQSLRRQGERPDIRVYSPLFVLGGIMAFALTITPFGLLPAIVLGTVVASLAELKLRPTQLFLLCSGLCLLAPFVFRVCLGLPIPMFRWPF